MSLYNMYPDYTATARGLDDRDGVFVYREASQTGGLGHATDYGQDLEDFMRAARESEQQTCGGSEQNLRYLLASRPLGALVAGSLMEEA